MGQRTVASSATKQVVSHETAPTGRLRRHFCPSRLSMSWVLAVVHFTQRHHQVLFTCEQPRFPFEIAHGLLGALLTENANLKGPPRPGRVSCRRLTTTTLTFDLDRRRFQSFLAPLHHRFVDSQERQGLGGSPRRGNFASSSSR